MEEKNNNKFLELVKVLEEAGWKVIKYEDLDGGVTLTLIPCTGKKEE